MSKNSAQQRLECFQNWLRVFESKRKREQKVNRKQQQEQIKYHPALKYNED